MKIFNILTSSLVLLVLVGCGSQVARDATTGASTTSNVTGTSTSTTGTQTGNIYGLPLAATMTAKINGVNGTVPTATMTVSTQATLKVKVTPLGAPNVTIPGYTNWVFPYGCLRMQVTVNGVTKTTSVLKVSGQTQGSTSQCASAATSEILDFGTAVNGAGSVSVVVSNAEYDNCRYTWPLNYGCSMSAIFQNHMAAATIQTQVDGTWMDP